MVIKEVCPGLFQIGDILGPRYIYQYLLIGGGRSLLIDTGIKTGPEQVILPALRKIGLKPRNLTYCINSHADVDHFGGNEVIRKACPDTILAAHASDTRWIQNKRLILKERYGWYKEHGMGYGADVEKWLAQALGRDTPLDLTLRGEEVIQLESKRHIRILHLPGHTDGHLGFYDVKNHALIVVDAILGKGLYDMQGNIIHPPPYFKVQPYLKSIDLCLSLNARVFLTGHYPIYQGEKVGWFLRMSKEFVHQCGRTVAGVLQKSRKPMSLSEIHAETNPRVGPFSSFPVELAGPIRAHLWDLMAVGKVNGSLKKGRYLFQWAG